MKQKASDQCEITLSKLIRYKNLYCHAVQQYLEPAALAPTADHFLDLTGQLLAGCEHNKTTSIQFRGRQAHHSSLATFAMESSDYIH